MKHHLDWSSYETAGQGDAYAGIPATGGDFARAVAVCIGDRLCQRTPKGVMCPSFRVSGEIAHSPGARVLALKAALNGELGAAPFADARLAEAMELCVGCKGCKRECANQVDMAAIKIEWQAQRNAALGVSRRDQLFAGLPRLLHRRPWLGALIGWRNRSPLLAQLGERWLGVAASRQLPQPAARPYLPPAIAPVLGERSVFLLVDTFAGLFQPHIAMAAQAVLHAAGYQVHVLRPLADATRHSRIALVSMQQAPSPCVQMFWQLLR
jgi:Fe-S oxidoreductase